MLLQDLPLTIEPSYPHAAELSAFGREEKAEAPDEADYVIRNIFWSFHRNADIIVYQCKSKLEWGVVPRRMLNLDMQLNTLKASDAWGIEQEARAVNTLASLLKHRQFKQYLMTGMFMERSPKSGVHYLFRRLRPTVAMTINRRWDKKQDRNPVRILCTLCMHPIGYYEESWAGAMCPTDDVVAHLTLMRGDEHMFWRRCNQHAPWAAQSGL